MGTGASKQQPEVKIVVVQSQEDGRIDAKLVRHAKQGKSYLFTTNYKNTCIHTLIHTCIAFTYIHSYIT